MKRSGLLFLTLMFVVGMTQMAISGEHGGKEHGGEEKSAKEHGGEESSKEHGGEAAIAPTNDEIRSAMEAYVLAESEATGTFDILDPDTEETRKLELVLVHERVGKTGDYYYSCADFKDTESGEMLDLDLDVADSDGTLSVVDVRIHKVDGEARYTYDENDNRIALGGTETNLEGGESSQVESEKEHGGEEHAKEHGGKEHGGN